MGSRWLLFDDVSNVVAKTKTVTVTSIHGSDLGTVKWFGRWRQYAFFPRPETVYNPECLRDICDKISELMAARRTPPTARIRAAKEA